MTSAVLNNLFKLSADKRADLALALWESLDESQREAEFRLSPEQTALLDRRWREHLSDPKSAIPWTEVRRKSKRI